MKIKLWNIQKIIVGIILGGIIGIGFLMQEVFRVNKIEDVGIESKVYAHYQDNGNPDQGYYNYYFEVKDNGRVWITHNLNRKGIDSDKRIYMGKYVKYNPSNPEEYVLLSDDKQIEIFNIFYYVITLPLLITVFYMVIFPDKIHKKIIQKFNATFTHLGS